MIQRTEFQVYATGYDTVQKQMTATTAASNAMDKSVKAAGNALDETGGALSEFGRKLDGLLKPLRLAANILPGLGLGGIILGGIEAAGWAVEKLGEKLDISSYSVKKFFGLINESAQAMQFYARWANEAAAQTAALIAKQDEAARKGYLAGTQARGASGQSSQFVTANAQIEAQRQELERLAQIRVELGRNPAASYYTTETQAELDKLAETAAARRFEAQGRFGEYSPEAYERAAAGYARGNYISSISKETIDARNKLLAEAQDLDLQAQHIMDTQRLSVEAIDDAVGQAQNKIQSLTKTIQTADKAIGGGPEHREKPHAVRYAKTGSAFDLLRPYAEFLGFDVDAIGDAIKNLPAYRKQLEDEFFRRMQPEPKDIKDFDPRAWAIDNGGGGIGKDIEGAPDLIDHTWDSLKQMGQGWHETSQGMIDDATNAAGLVASAMGQMAQAVGMHLANLIIAGNFGAKELKKEIGNILAGISAQAFGYAVLLEAMAAASALVPFAGLPAATGLAAAGGIMAGAGVALGVTARLLGADPVGGRGGHASGGGAGSSGGGGAPYNGFRQSGQDTHVTVIIGGEVVTRGVTAETRRLERRGGITEPRLQRAGAGA